MTLPRVRLARALCLLACACAPALAAAEDAPAGAPTAQPTESTTWTAEPESRLQELRAGQGVSANAAELQSSVTGNQIGDGVVTGDITLSDSALANVQGISVALFNSGNNVSMQNNLNISVHLD